MVVCEAFGSSQEDQPQSYGTHLGNSSLGGMMRFDQPFVVYGIPVEDRRTGKGAGFPAPFPVVALALLFGFSLLINRAASFVVAG